MIQGQGKIDLSRPEEWARLALAAQRWSKDRDLCEDAVQETLLAALRQPNATVDDPRGWLVRVLRNRIWSRQAQSERDRGRLDPKLVDRAAEPIRTIPSEEVSRAWARLDPLTRELLWRRVVAEESAADLAAELGVPASTVRTRVRRGLDELRRRLGPQGAGTGKWAAAWWALGKPWPIAGRIAALVIGFAGVGLLWRSVKEPGDLRPIEERLQSSRMTTSAEVVEHGALEVAAPERGSAVVPSVGVTTATGAPAAGARVFVFDADTLDPVLSGGESVRILDARGNLTVGDVHNAAAMVVAEAHAPALGTIQDGRLLPLVLQRGTSLAGVVTRAGAAVRGAHVHWRAMVFGCALEWHAVTEVDGSFAITGLPTREQLEAAPWRHANSLTVDDGEPGCATLVLVRPELQFEGEAARVDVKMPTEPAEVVTIRVLVEGRTQLGTTD